MHFRHTLNIILGKGLVKLHVTFGRILHHPQYGCRPITNDAFIKTQPSHASSCSVLLLFLQHFKLLNGFYFSTYAAWYFQFISQRYGNPPAESFSFFNHRCAFWFYCYYSYTFFLCYGITSFLSRSRQNFLLALTTRLQQLFELILILSSRFSLCSLRH